MDLLHILQTLNACHGPSGDEAGVREAIRTLAQPFADEIWTDTLGNLIVHRKGSGPKVLFAAHMDSIGCIVTHIDEQGFLRFGRLGGLSAADLIAVPVRFGNGTRGVIAMPEGAELKELKLDQLYIDIGAGSREEAQTWVELGDTAVFDAPVYVQGERVVSPYLDNRVSCAVLLLALERIRERQNDLYFAFTVQEEVGLRGARTAAFALEPDYAVAMDVTDADDVPGSKHTCTAKLGEGAAIKVMDHSVICHPALVSGLRALARERGISAQTDIMRSGGTDAGAIHQSRGGVVTGGISVPCRYIHTPQEMADRRDVEACAALAAALAQCDLRRLGAR